MINSLRVREVSLYAAYVVKDTIGFLQLYKSKTLGDIYLCFAFRCVIYFSHLIFSFQSNHPRI